MHPLDSPRVKCERSLEHLQALNTEWESFLNRHPHEIAVQFDVEAQCYAAVLRVNEDPPLRLGAIFGDLIHNLRSALDLVAWRVARLSRSHDELMKRKVRHVISFPLTLSPEQFAEHPFVPFASEEARAVVERVQPYHGPDKPERHPLAVLNRVSNADKHRLFHAAIGAISWHQVRFRPGYLSMDAFEAMTFSIDPIDLSGQAAEDGTKVAWLRFDPPPDDPNTTDVQVNGYPRTEVLFPDAPYVVSEWELADLCTHVRWVVGEFAPLFPAH